MIEIEVNLIQDLSDIPSLSRIFDTSNLLLGLN